THLPDEKKWERKHPGASGCVGVPDLVVLIGPRHAIGPAASKARTAEITPRGRPRAEPDPNCGRWRQRDLGALNGRHGARRSFLGARRKARSRQAGANGQAASTLKSCLVQPGG